MLQRLAVVMHGDGHVGPRQRGAADHFHAMAQLGLLGLQEFAARRRVEVQMLHIDGGADTARGRLGPPGLRDDLRGVGVS